MSSKVFTIVGLVLVLIGTGLLGFASPKKGKPIQAPNPWVAYPGIALICLGSISQIIGVALA